jgi:hypothetical protein
MSPGNAILASLLVPGSAHFALGRPLRGAVALAVTVGMFAAGYAILGDRLFHCVLFEPFEGLGTVFRFVPIHLLPEAPNLGCSILAGLFRDLPDAATSPEARDALFEAQRRMRLPVAGEHLAFWLTGSSGIVACLFAADAHSLALGHEPRARNRASMAALSFLVPGSGHFLAGQRDKGLLVGGAVIALFVLGLLLSSGLTVDRSEHPAYWITQAPFGGGTLVAALFFGPLEILEVPRFYNLGYTLTGCAGLLNLVVMVDAYTVVDRSPAIVPVAGVPA